MERDEMGRWEDRHTKTWFYAFIFVFAIFRSLYQSLYLLIKYAATYPPGFWYRGCSISAQTLAPKKNKEKKSLHEIKMTEKRLKQARIQLLKEVSQAKFQSFPLQLSKYHDLLSLTFVLRYQCQYVGWVLISARSVEECISVERLSTLNTYLQSILQNINKFAVC